MAEEHELVDEYGGPPIQDGGAVSGSVATISGLAATDIALPNDPTVSAPWASYFDSLGRKYFYVNTSTGIAQYEHPSPPIFLGSETLVIDTTTPFLPNGWIKLQNITLNLPYYLNVLSLESLWVHPNPPPNPSSLQQVVDATLNSTYKKYTDPTTTKPFFINSATLEGQWNFPDTAFLVGPSTAQQASSALAQAISGAQASSALAQSISGAQQSSAVAQQASSALAQTASSALAQSISGAQQSSAVAQQASSAVAQTVSSALAQTASSAQQLQTLAGPVADKDGIVQTIQTMQADIDTQVAILYSPNATQADKDTVLQSIRDSMAALQGQWQALNDTSATIFSIAPMYQDRTLQTPISDPYLEGKGFKKLYDTMRKAYVVIDSNGYLVPNIETPSIRTPLQSGGATGPTGPSSSGLLTTDVALPNDTSVTAPWTSYFDTVARKYFYVNSSTGVAQYEHPSPPVFSGSDTVIADTTVAFLPSGWVKLQSTAKNLPYYVNVLSTETRWVHPNPPPNPSTLTQVVDATLGPSYKKYMDPTTGKRFFINSATLEGQWDFPDSAFLVGPSTAQQASSALAQAISGAQQSSAVAQVASSAVAQTVSSAVQQADSSAQQQVASSAMYDMIESATVSYRYILISVIGTRGTTPGQQAALCGFFVNRTRVPVSWNKGATAIAVDPTTYAPLSSPGGGQISYSAGSTYGNIFDATFGAKVWPVTTGTGILIDNTVPISFNAYYFGVEAVADRDMISWTIKGSKDGVVFVVVDDKASGPQTDLVPNVRNSFIPPIELNLAANRKASSAFKQLASSAVAQVASSALAQVASSAVAETVSSALAQAISGAQASSATAQFVSSARQQTASSAVQQADSSAQQQQVSSAVQQADSSAKQQFASSAMQQADSSAQKQQVSSAVQQADSSAQQQADSSAKQQQASSSFQQRDSSAQQQQVSSAVQQADSSAQQQFASSAKQQFASSAMQQADSSAQKQQVSSAVQQADSSAQQQFASSAKQQADSSAQHQQASSAVQQADSSAQHQQASSAVQQADSSAQHQQASSAVQQADSSAQHQQASSARAEGDLTSYISDKDSIKAALLPMQTDANTLIRTVYSPAGGVTMANLSDLQNSVGALMDQQNTLHTMANNIFRFHDYYQDPAFQTQVPDTNLSSMGLKRVFDTLRNKYIVLDSKGKIVADPVVPAARGYTTFVLRGGKRAPKYSRRFYME
jgi:chemotaxis protein histidine kinase CheA